RQYCGCSLRPSADKVKASSSSFSKSKDSSTQKEKSEFELVYEDEARTSLYVFSHDLVSRVLVRLPVLIALIHYPLYTFGIPEKRREKMRNQFKSIAQEAAKAQNESIKNDQKIEDGKKSKDRMIQQGKERGKEREKEKEKERKIKEKEKVQASLKKQKDDEEEKRSKRRREEMVREQIKKRLSEEEEEKWKNRMESYEKLNQQIQHSKSEMEMERTRIETQSARLASSIAAFETKVSTEMGQLTQLKEDIVKQRLATKRRLDADIEKIKQEMQLEVASKLQVITQTQKKNEMDIKTIRDHLTAVTKKVSSIDDILKHEVETSTMGLNELRRSLRKVNSKIMDTAYKIQPLEEKVWSLTSSESTVSRPPNALPSSSSSSSSYQTHETNPSSFGMEGIVTPASKRRVCDEPEFIHDVESVPQRVEKKVSFALEK
ncbi:hypothetical protein ADUPG1_008567, partial [Aduncisulcus paluster]